MSMIIDRLINKIIKKDTSKKIDTDDFANLMLFANLTKDYSVLKKI